MGTMATTPLTHSMQSARAWQPMHASEALRGQFLQPLVRTQSMARATPPTREENELIMRAERNIDNDVRKAMTVAAGVLAHHPAAHAVTEMTPSLRNLLGSFVAGGFVLAIIAAAIIFVSGFDPVTRE